MSHSSSRQTKFTSEGLGLVPEGVTRESVVLRKTLEATKVLCPYCLHYGTLWDFKTLLKEKKGHLVVSQAKCRCPDCYQGYMKKTLLRISEMTMEEYGNWFWGGVFTSGSKEWGIYEKISWDKLKQRLKNHFDYETRQIFWEVYWEYKDQSTGGKTQDDRQAFEDYKQTYEQLDEPTTPPISSSEEPVNQCDVDIEDIRKLLMSQRRPITVASIQYMLESSVSLRQVTRALETMEKEGTVVYAVGSGWKLYGGENRVTENKIKVGFENLPTPIVEYLQGDVSVRHPQPHRYHVTEIIYCLMKAWYRRMHPERSTWTTRSLWNISRGNTFDQEWTSLFEVHQKNYRVKRQGITVTGTLDFVYDDGGGDILYDLKMPASTFYKRRGGAGLGYRRQVQSYLALAHANGELLDVHRARVLMVAGDVVVEEVEEWLGMLDSWLWPRAEALDAALGVGTPAGLPVAEEGWECGADPEGVPYCSADQFFRKICGEDAEK